MTWCERLWPITGTGRSRPVDPRLGRTRQPAPTSGTARPPAAHPGDQSARLEEQAILCAVCKARITDQRQATAIDGHHEHAFFNPSGIAFEIRCFRAAPGAIPRGGATAAFTWFPGYRWRFVQCALCRTHLGWLFTGADSFHGLIASLLR